MTLVIYTEEPKFPATDQNPKAVRYQVGNLWVDSDSGTAPTQADIDAVFAPGLAQQQKIAAIKANPRRQALLNALVSTDDAGIVAAVVARYPGLPANAIAAITDIALILAAWIRS